MPKTPTAEQSQRAEVRRLRGSVLRLETTLRSGRLSPVEVVMAERELRRATNALNRALRRGRVGRPRLNPEVPSQGAQSHSDAPATSPKRQPAEHGEPGHLCDALCRLLGFDDGTTLVVESVIHPAPAEDSRSTDGAAPPAPSASVESALPTSTPAEESAQGEDLIYLALNPPTRDRGLRKGKSKNIPDWALAEYADAIKPQPQNGTAPYPTFGIPGL